MHTALYYSASHDPRFNLALEDLLFRTVEPETVILYLWQNQNTVVIGKSQNAWKECRVSQLEADGGVLVRRTSGGGAVFQDLGNVCFTFIASSGLYDLEKQLRVVLEAVGKLGVRAHFTGRNDICTEDGRKFSGNAFRFSGDVGLMHGTLLLDADFGKMSRYLQVSKAKIAAKGVDSVRSRVVNLRELAPSVTPERADRALADAFATVYCGGCAPRAVTVSPARDEDGGLEPALPGSVDFPELLRKFSSWEWRFGETIPFDMEFEKKFDWGLVQLALRTENGRIWEAEVSTDAMDADLGEALSACLRGRTLSMPELTNALHTACALLRTKNPTLADMDQVARDMTAMLYEML